MEWLRNFDLEQWWNVAIVAGLGITIASLTAKNREGAILGLGILAWGFGEKLNHPRREAHFPNGILTSHRRDNGLPGLIVCAIGVGLFIFGVYGLIRS
jgi:hypothetical protein